MSVSVVSMVRCRGVSWCNVYVGYGDVLEVFLEVVFLCCSC